VMLPVSHFNVKRSGDLYKQCNYCREKANEYNKEYKKNYRCVHNKRKEMCSICNINGHLRKRIIDRMRRVIDNPKFEYLGCNIEEFKTHLESTFKKDMSWEVIDKIHIDHIKPLGAKGITHDEKIKRLNYKNTQALFAADNIRKSNSDSENDIDSLTEQLNIGVTL